MSETITADALRAFAGRSFVSVAPSILSVEEPWDRVFGLLSIEGGCEISIDPERLQVVLEGDDGSTEFSHRTLIPAVVIDGAYPRVDVVVGIEQLASEFNPIEPNTGPRSSEVPKPCSHHEVDHNCRSCFRQWWEGRAREEGLIETGQESPGMVAGRVQ